MRTKANFWFPRRFGLADYAVAWTLCFWLGGTALAIIPAVIVSYPLAKGIGVGVERVWEKIFS